MCELVLSAGQDADGHTLDVGERVIVRLNVTRDGLLDLGLCGDRACSVVRVTGVEDGERGAMGFSTRITSINSVADERGQTLQQVPPPAPTPYELSPSRLPLSNPLSPHRLRAQTRSHWAARSPSWCCAAPSGGWTSGWRATPSERPPSLSSPTANASRWTRTLDSRPSSGVRT